MRLEHGRGSICRSAFDPCRSFCPATLLPVSSRSTDPTTLKWEVGYLGQMIVTKLTAYAPCRIASSTSCVGDGIVIYIEWGFTSSPFQTTSLPATDLGERLLVGRDTVLKSLMGRITSVPKLATVEGLNGVGKTSIVNVAAHKLYKRFIESGTGPLYVPCGRTFQLSAEQSLQDFIDLVYIEIAQTLIARAEDIKKHGHWLETAAINRWLNSPELTTFQGGVWVVQAGMQRQLNSGVGFERSGLRNAVGQWLKTIFPTPEEGAIICTIDNLELLQSSETARSMLERMRDELFHTAGIRWVLCGSLGIVYGVVSSPRPEGYLHKPIEIGEIGAEHIKDLLRSRIAAYSDDPNLSYIPINVEEFEFLYLVLKGNTRSVLSYTDDYCQWISDRDRPISEGEKTQAFLAWLKEQAEAAYEASRQELRPKALEVFSQACVLGVFSPSDFEAFGFNSIPAFRPHIRDLELAGLVVSTQDEGDKRRKTIQVTPKGWIVKFYRDENPTV